MQFAIVLLQLLANPVALDFPSPVPHSAAEAGYTWLAVDEEFDQSTADLLTRWSPRFWHDPQSATKEPVAVHDGIATFTVPAAPRFRGARLSSWPYRTFRFGFFEARMRWPATDGNHAAFWLASAASARAGTDRNSRPRHCEIDISEALPRGGYHSTVHDWLTADTQTAAHLKNDRSVLGFDTAEWHTYGALWKPGQITFYFDGEAVNSVKAPEVCNEQDMILVFGAQRRDNKKQTAEFDWLRVWQAPPPTSNLIRWPNYYASIIIHNRAGALDQRSRSL